MKLNEIIEKQEPLSDHRCESCGQWALPRPYDGAWLCPECYDRYRLKLQPKPNRPGQGNYENYCQSQMAFRSGSHR